MQESTLEASSLRLSLTQRLLFRIEHANCLGLWLEICKYYFGPHVSKSDLLLALGPSFKKSRALI